MVDIHCHILPGIDDGAIEEDVASEMAQMAAADGITHIVATPHSNYRFPFDPDRNQRKREELQKAIGGSPTLLAGCDFHLSYENLEDLRTHPDLYTINAKQYLLVEFADVGIPPHMDQIFFDLMARNLVPIITHPERNPLLAHQPELLREWVELGCFVQVTASSLLGRFGKHAREAARRFLRHQLIHFIASDAHNTTSRPPLLSEARAWIASDQGEQLAQALSEANPLAAVEGRELPWQPPPQEARARKWFSLFR